MGGGEPVKPSEPPRGLSAIGNPIVSSAIGALNGRNKELWFELFSEKAEFSDDGIPRDLTEWCEEELFGPSLAYLISIDRVEDGGLTLYAMYHSDKWGDFKTSWRFVVEGGKISKLDVGATSY